MKPLTKIDIRKLAADCGIAPLKREVLAESVIGSINQYKLNSLKGSYGRDGVLRTKIKYGEKIRHDKKQKRKINLTYPKPLPGRPPNIAQTILISYIATAFTRAGGAVTLNPQGELPSPFNKFINSIYESIGLYNTRDFISDHMSARRRLVYNPTTKTLK